MKSLREQLASCRISRDMVEYWAKKKGRTCDDVLRAEQSQQQLIVFYKICVILFVIHLAAIATTICFGPVFSSILPVSPYAVLSGLMMPLCLTALVALGTFIVSCKIQSTLHSDCLADIESLRKMLRPQLTADALWATGAPLDQDGIQTYAVRELCRLEKLREMARNDEWPLVGTQFSATNKHAVLHDLNELRSKLYDVAIRFCPLPQLYTIKEDPDTDADADARSKVSA